jgi:hypothetical protein
VGRKVEVGITISGRDTGAKAELRKTSEEARKLEKQMTGVMKGIATSSPIASKALGALGLAGGAAAAAMMALRSVLAGFVDMARNAAPDLRETVGEVSRFDAALISMKKASEANVGAFGQLVLAIDGFINKTDEALIRSQIAAEKDRARRETMLANVVALAKIEEETERGLQRDREEIDRKFAAMRRKREEDEQKIATARQKRADALRAQFASEAKAQQLISAHYAEQKRLAEEAAKAREIDLARAAKSIDEMVAARARHRDRMLDFAEDEARSIDILQARATEAAKTRAEEMAASYAQTFSQVGAAMGSVLTTIIDLEATAAEKFKSIANTMIGTLVDMVMKAVNAYAVQAAAAQFAASATLPGIGLLAGGAAASAALAAVRALAGQLTGFAEGGIVGGRPGKDKVIARLTRGEMVLPVDLTNQIMSLAGGGMQPAMAGGGGVTIVNQNKFPMTRMQIDRQSREFTVASLRRLGRSGKGV